VGSVAEVELFNDENGKPRGCGLVVFSSPDIARDALRKLDRYDWKGRKLSVKKASDKDRDEFGRLIGGKGRPGKGNHECRVYVSNLPYEMKWQDVKDMFRDHVGETSFVELFNDEKGKPRGCGILEFSSEEMAQKAIRKLNKHEIKGRKILVQEAMDYERDKYGHIMKGMAPSLYICFIKAWVKR
jgi:RNA recognition motif-containing protein